MNSEGTLRAKEHVTIREAAHLTGKSERWIRKQIKAGALPAIQEPMGEIYTWLIAIDDLQAWLLRPPADRGRAAGAHGRYRYTITIPADEDIEAELIKALSKVPGVLARRSRGKVLLDTR